MALFQNSVINKYLQKLDRQVINTAYARFDKSFHDPARQENIRNSKEEQYQGEFLIDLFVNILGYTKNPSPKYNLTTEYKNVKDSKKADGAILINDAVKAVIELKGTETTDLSKIENQAFGYKNNQPDCAYVIISNFEKLRFYIDNAIEHIEFNLFTLTETEFELLYLCLAYDNLKQGIPKQIKDESLSQEGAITKKLYNDYSLFKRELHQNLVKLNPGYEPLELFKKSQKLLDRFLFLFFAEDRLLLPPNSVRLILSDWRDLQDRDVEIPLYDRFKNYFEYLNTGYKGKRYEVFAYNGGLFKPDAILDAVKIEDELLHRHTSKLSEYDFGSEVDVNILGHIFENSLNELDEIKAQLAGQAVDKTQTKRKKDGVFYTPKYITKYIVENTLGKLCTEQKAELQINEDDYTGDKRKNKQTRQTLSDKLTVYRNWLLQLTICDPACGSGAFLNQALDFLINEHRYLDELHAKLYGDAMVLSDIEKSILENNLFGVDLNEESVEIAKLSLWLRTAQPNRKLNDLNNNIKCGNSLIDDPTVAGEKAFNWQKEFPKVFEKGGFDVVIGNPPYLGGRDWKDEDGRNYQYFIEKYEVAEYQFDMYAVFWEKGVKLIKKNGYIGFITPNTWLNNLKTEKLRNFILSNTSVIVVADYSEIKVFEDAVVLPVIFILKNSISQCKTKIYKPIDKGSDLILSHEFSQQYWLNEDYKIININIIEKEKTLNNKIQTGCKKLEDLAEVKFGIKIYETGKGNPPQLPEFSENHIYESNSQVDNTYKKYLEGKDVNSYSISWESRWLKYGENLAAPRDKELFVGPRLLVRRITGERLISTYIEEDFVTSQLLQIVKPIDEKNAKWILAILNSSLMVFFFKRKYNRLDKTFPEIRIYELRELPIKVVSTDDQQPFTEKADLMLSLNKELQETSQKFQRTLQRKFELAELPGKLQAWYLLSYADFIKELGKKKIKLSLAQEAEWEEYFVQEAKRAQELKATIDATDKAIDQMVYALYGLTEEEIKIVEGNDK